MMEAPIGERTTGDVHIFRAPTAGSDAVFDWDGLRRRLAASHAAMERKLTPSAEEEQKILHTRARSLAARGKAEAPAPQLLLQVVEFVMGDEHYGLETSHIREIQPLSEFTPLPCTPDFVLGLVNVRGQILSIIDLKKLFALPDQGLTELNKVIILHTHQMELGILADAILGMRSITLNELQPALPTLTGIRAEYLKGITKDPLVILDAERILSDKKILVSDVLDTTT